MTPKILIVLGSTRQNRQGAAVARWVTERASQRADADFELIDLKDWPLPFLESAVPPAFGQYDVAARPWADKVASADGYVFVTPEYNHGYPAVLKNALDHLYREWGHKPAAVASYGASSGGYRAAEQLRQVFVELRMVPVREQVGVPTVWEAFDEEGQVRDEGLVRAADTMLDELVWWAATLKPARAVRLAAAA
ncbi:MAG TPA: NAD(P)H-dependent oxidoreductase [Ktedonobacterales bacterium]|nr:NAD(P)H-dependent oxidoreductase [Ktedonobacterales bacterium]